MLNYAHGRLGAYMATLLGTTVLLTVFGLEHFAGYEPCVLCWTQRAILAAYIALGVYGMWFLPHSKAGHVIYSLLVNLVAMTGLGVAIRHVYLLHAPAGSSCGPSANVMFDMLPFSDALKEFFVGSPSCSNVDLLLGLPFPYWSLAFFGILTLMSLSFMFNPKEV